MMSRNAKIKFHHNNNCFIRLPKRWGYELDITQNLLSFEMVFGEDKKAYVSWAGEFTMNATDVVEISREYGLKLGLHEETEVILQKLQTLPAPCNEVKLNPITDGDYNILEINAALVEEILLDQIRLIWKEQVFPVWTQKRVNLFVKVDHTVPSDQPVLLVNSTKVFILRRQNGEQMPKDSSCHNVPSATEKFPSPTPFSDRGFEVSNDFNSTGDENFSSAESSTAFSMVSSIINYFVPQSSRPFLPSESCVDYSSKINEPKKILPFKIDLKLRVVPFLDTEAKYFSCPPSLQVNTAYISEKTLQPHGTPLSPLPSTFLAKVTKIMSPSERQEKLNKAVSERVTPGGVSKKEKEHRKANQNKGKIPLLESEGHTPVSEVTMASSIVQIFVVKSLVTNSLWARDLHHNPDSISLCDAVRRQLGLTDCSFIHLESIHYEPGTFTDLICHPLSYLSTSFTEEKIVEAFVLWLEKLSSYTGCVMLSSTTMIPLSIEKRTIDVLVNFSKSTDDSLTLSETDIHKYSSPRKHKRRKTPSLTSEFHQYGYFTPSSIKHVSIKVGHQISADGYVSYHKLNNLRLKVPGVKLETLGGVSAVGDKCLTFLELWLGLHPLSKCLSNRSLLGGNILIYGCKGVGKSTLSGALCRELSEPPNYVYTHVIDCKGLRGKRVENISRKWEAACAEAVYKQPSIVLLDDLDLIASAALIPEQEASSDGLYFTRTAQAFLSFLEDLRSCHAKVSVIATAKSWQSLHPSLTNARGQHVFQEVVEIPLPISNQRKEILCSLVQSKIYLSSETIKSVCWDKISAKTEGYVAKDLDLLVDKATHAAWLRSDLEEGCSEDEVIVTDEDFEVAMKSFTPASLQGLSLQQGGEKSLDDIGGLQEVKKVLHEILLWPVKYPTLFAEYPLRPESGILLYGAPGTGKTLIAGVVAKEWGLNFISIKGPELLSKYIGASEQAVREVFQKAQSAKPCILFFDEFDAIAPRRGHDSTGVTDRVVNQFLTQMDGVEAIDGVYVLAATSRPDLIDPALLRPGRLDRCLYCPLPDEDDRLEILNALSRYLSLSTDVDLKAIAEIAVHFTGADLQALLYSAQLEALHEDQGRFLTLETQKELTNDEEFELNQIEDIVYLPSIAEGAVSLLDDKEEKLLQEVNVIKVNVLGQDSLPGIDYLRRRHSSFSFSIAQRHLLKVVSQMKPSVFDKERQRYESIYESFIMSRGGDFSSLKMLASKRVTLA